jgi:hypothetical protein
MSFNGSGTFTLNVGGYPYQPNTLIVSANVNALLNDIANGLSLTVTRDGQMSMTGPLHMANQLIDGIKNLQFGTTTSSPSGTMDGLFLTAAHTIGLAVNGSVVQSWTATGTTFSGGAITAPAFIPNGSTVPVNGIYLPAANTLGFATNTTEWGSVNSTGNWVILAASSGSTFTLPAGAVNPVSLNFGAAGTGFYAPATNQLALAISGTQAILVTSTGVTIDAPQSTGTSLAVNGISGASGLIVTGVGGVFSAEFTNSGANDAQIRLNTSSATQSAIASYWLNSVGKGYFGVVGGAGAYVTGASQNDMIWRVENNNLILCANAGGSVGAKLNSSHVFSVNADNAGTLYEVGFRDIPLIGDGSNYTLVATDRGKCRAATAAITYTVPANVFAVNNIVTILNLTGGNITIAQGTSLTMYQSGTGNTGNRTLAQRGSATIYFSSATVANIQGAGLS